MTQLVSSYIPALQLPDNRRRRKIWLAPLLCCEHRVVAGQFHLHNLRRQQAAPAVDQPWFVLPELEVEMVWAEAQVQVVVGLAVAPESEVVTELAQEPESEVRVLAQAVALEQVLG